MSRLVLDGVVLVGLSWGTAGAQTPPVPQAQPGTAAQIGEKIDRGLRGLNTTRL